MELTPEQIKKFVEIHKGHPEFEKYTEAEVREIANGVANYYLTLFKISRRLEKRVTKKDANASLVDTRQDLDELLY